VKLSVNISLEMPLLYQELENANNKAERLKVLALLGLIYEKNISNISFNLNSEKNVAINNNNDIIEKNTKEIANDNFLLNILGD
jgi:hypothetical protein